MNIACFLLGHQYRVSQELTRNSRRLHCARCAKMFAMNDEVRLLIDWTPDVQELYERSFGINMRWVEGEKQWVAM